MEEVKNIWFLEEERGGKREKQRWKVVEAVQWISVEGRDGGFRMCKRR